MKYSDEKGDCSEPDCTTHDFYCTDCKNCAYHCTCPSWAERYGKYRKFCIEQVEKNTQS